MIPPSGASLTGGGGGKVKHSPQGVAKGMIGGGAAAAGYSSGNDYGSVVGGIEIDPFTGIPYYDPAK